ncbi:MAG: class I SAM-dependent methyltransferase [Patescibacteria group bacterium]
MGLKPARKVAATTKTAWNKSAEWYDEYLEAGDSYQARVILPSLLRLLRLRRDEKILDLACGQGFFAREFASAGAQVTGADAAENLIKLAQQKNPDLKFLVAPAHQTGLNAQSFDKIALISAIQNIHNPDEVLKECARLLKPKGTIHIVLNHPAFRIPGKSSWDYEGTEQIRKISGYLSESKATIRMHPGKDPGAVTYSYHRPLQTYFKWLAHAGLAVTGLEEWISDRTSATGTRAAAENKARKEIPLFMYIEATKR